jgi:hypothetical protein
MLVVGIVVASSTVRDLLCYQRLPLSKLGGKRPASFLGIGAWEPMATPIIGHIGLLYPLHMQAITRLALLFLLWE